MVKEEPPGRGNMQHVPAPKLTKMDAKQCFNVTNSSNIIVILKDKVTAAMIQNTQ